MEKNKIYQGDCLKVMKTFSDNSIDTIITDPPYGIGFMGKEWDNFKSEKIDEAMAKDKRPHKGIASQRRSNFAGKYDLSQRGLNGFQKWFNEISVEMLRVIKPGGTLLCFGGSRTYHRLACAVEDAGWILKDCIMWLYGSGFPKATDIALQFEKKLCYRGKYKGKDEWLYKYTHHLMATKPPFRHPNANKHYGWKSHGLKPAYEPVLTCFKPLTPEQYFAKIVLEITNLIVILCQNSNVKDAEKIFSDIQAKLKKVLEHIVVDNVRINLWENLENVKFVEKNSISKNVDSKTHNLKQGSVPINVKGNGKADTIKKMELDQQKKVDIGEKIIPVGEVEDMYVKILDISTFVITENISENIALLWKNISEELLKKARWFTIETAIKLTIGLRTLRLSLTPNTLKNTGNLSPNYSPKLVAMKPNDGTYANNALKHGVAGLNIDGGRIGIEIMPAQKRGNSVNTDFMSGGFTPEHTGRFPANIILDEEAAKLLDKQSGERPSGGRKAGQSWLRKGDIIYKGGTAPQSKVYRDYISDTGGASRFFYVAKASKAERNMGCEDMEEKQTTDGCIRSNPESARKYQANSALRKNNHPTVKPLKLMEYLCILTKTPTGGLVLDPFAGSGTTLMACKKTGRDYIGIEQDKEYCKIAEARIKAVRVDNKLFN